MNANPRYIEHGMGDFNPPDDGMREARGWMRTGELMSSAEWVRDTIGLIAERHWIAIAEAMSDGDECEAGRCLKHALERHAIDDVHKLNGIDLRNAEYLAQGEQP